jgi:flagellar basal body-associated protein FliL
MTWRDCDADPDDPPEIEHLSGTMNATNRGGHVSRNNTWWIALVAAIAGLLIGAVGVWAVQSSKTADLASRLVKADANTRAALQQVDELKAAQSAAQPTTTVVATATVETTAPAQAAPAKKTVTVKQFAFVKKVSTSGSHPVITVDYALMLTGKAAAKAATAHGDESPPPNDYYIVNDNKMLRKLPVKSGITVTATTNSDGTADSTGHKITFAKWAAVYAAPNSTNEAQRSAPYWLIIKNGVVTSISEQYLP